MKHALTKIQASTSDGAGRLAGLVRQGVLACVLVSVGAGALAQNHDRDPRREEVQQGMRERFQMQAQDPRFDPRFDSRAEEMREEQRRQAQLQQEQQRSERRSGGRMTPDERRDLRRQINEAGMDLYPNARRR